MAQVCDLGDTGDLVDLGHQMKDLDGEKAGNGQFSSSAVNTRPRDVLSQLPNWSGDSSDDGSDDRGVIVEDCAGISAFLDGDHETASPSAASDTALLQTSAQQDANTAAVPGVIPRLEGSKSRDKRTAGKKTARHGNIDRNNDGKHDTNRAETVDSSSQSSEDRSNKRNAKKGVRAVVRMPRRRHIKNGESFTDPMRQVSMTNEADIKQLIQTGNGLDSVCIRFSSIWHTYIDEAVKAINQNRFSNALVLLGMCRSLDLSQRVSDRCAIYESTCHTELGDFDEAIRKAEHVLSNDSINVHAQMALGNALFRRGELEMALVWFYRAAKNRPNNTRVVSQLGRCQRHLWRVFRTVSDIFRRLLSIEGSSNAGLRDLTQSRNSDQMSCDQEVQNIFNSS